MNDNDKAKAIARTLLEQYPHIADIMVFLPYLTESNRCLYFVGWNDTSRLSINEIEHDMYGESKPSSLTMCCSLTFLMDNWIQAHFMILPCAKFREIHPAWK